MITAGTITDEQIRELLRDLLKKSGNQLTNDTDACGMALIDPTESRFVNRKDDAAIIRALSRARCAEILNARGAK